MLIRLEFYYCVRTVESLTRVVQFQGVLSIYFSLELEDESSSAEQRNDDDSGSGIDEVKTVEVNLCDFYCNSTN